MAAKRSAVPRSPAQIRPIEDFPSVVEYVQAQEELEEFIGENQPLYTELCRLVSIRNTKLEEAAQVVRPTGCTVGPFHKLSDSKKIDAEKLFEEIGAEDFNKVGGYTETVVEYKVDRERFLALAKANQVPAEIVDVVVKESSSYTVIPKYVLP